jgi:hypothetical protein
MLYLVPALMALLAILASIHIMYYPEKDRGGAQVVRIMRITRPVDAIDNHYRTHGRDAWAHDPEVAKYAPRNEGETDA